MDIQFREATEKDQPVLSNLGRYYSYDISEYAHAHSDWYHCDDNGEFQSGCDQYFGDASYSSFLFRVEAELSGFAIIQKLQGDPHADYTVSEFFITRAFRRRGVGKYVAHTLFDKFPGRWDVMVWPVNTSALLFWDKVITEYAGDSSTATFERPARYHGWRMCVYRFTSRIER